MRPSMVVIAGRNIEQQSRQIMLFDQRCRLAQREPSQVALAALAPVIDNLLDCQREHVDPARYRTAISKAFRILIASDRRPTDPAGDARLLESFPRGLPVRRRAGPRPTLRQHPATRLARGDQQDQAIAIRADTHWKGGILAV